MSKKLKSKIKKMKPCYPVFDRFLESMLKGTIKKSRSYPQDKKDPLAWFYSTQPKKGVRLSKREIRIAQKRLKNKDGEK